MTDQAPPVREYGVDPELVSLASEDLLEVVAALEGIKSIVAGLATLLKAQATAARAAGLQ